MPSQWRTTAPNYSWRHRMMSITALFMLTNVVVASVCGYYVHRRSVNLSHDISSWQKKMAIINDTRFAIDEQSWYHCLVLGTDNPREMRESAHAMSHATKKLVAYINLLAATFRDKPLVDELELVLDELLESQAVFLEILERGDHHDMLTGSKDLLQYTFSMRQLVMMVSEQVEKSLDDSVAIYLRDGRTGTLLILVLTCVVLGLGLCLGWVTSSRLTRPLVSIEHSLKRVLAGETDVTFTDEGLGEIDTLVSALKQTLSSLGDTQEKLLAQEKLASLGAVTAGIAHEIRNPLNFVKNFSEVCDDLLEELAQFIEIQARSIPPGEFTRISELIHDLQVNVGKIKNHSDRVNSIAQTMLLHSTGSSTEARQLTHLGFLVEESINIASTSFDKVFLSDRAPVVTFHAEEALPELVVVKEDIRRAIINILQNAYDTLLAKSSRLGASFQPKIEVSLRSDEEQVCIEITDNGEGIREDDLEKIFNPFYTNKPSGQGTGLGLSIAHEIIMQRHRGDLRIESELGDWTRVIVLLPRH